MTLSGFFDFHKTTELRMSDSPVSRIERWRNLERDSIT